MALMAEYQLVDPQGRPVRKSDLTTELAGATIGGVRSPITGYPADGLNPMSLAGILRDADAGNALRYLELAETIEERDAHYIGVLGTRRRSVSQIEITVDAASDDPTDEAIAQDLRNWIKRDELTEELFDILDCIGKGYSVTEIIWDHSEGQWQPIRLEYRDPRWFRFSQADLKTPMLIGESGEEIPLAPFKFIFAQIRAKSGLALRSGIARIAAWGWMFKAYTQRDWAIFTQTYGQPIRLGKFGAGASEEDKSKLFRAVANIAGDCAAIIPESMQIEFVEAGNIGAAHQLYKERADWLDQQI
jgi:phage gp29-like protein